MQRTHGVIFMGDGSPEDRPESVSSDKTDTALDPLDLQAHQVEDRRSTPGNTSGSSACARAGLPPYAHREDRHFLPFSLREAVAGFG